MGEKLLLLSNWGDVYPTRIIILYIIRIKGLFIVASTVTIMITMLPLLTCFMLLVLRAFKVNLLSYSKLYKKKKKFEKVLSDIIVHACSVCDIICLDGCFVKVLLFGFAINSYYFFSLPQHTDSSLSLS